MKFFLRNMVNPRFSSDVYRLNRPCYARHKSTSSNFMIFFLEEIHNNDVCLDILWLYLFRSQFRGQHPPWGVASRRRRRPTRARWFSWRERSRSCRNASNSCGKRHRWAGRTPELVVRTLDWWFLSQPSCGFGRWWNVALLYNAYVFFRYKDIDLPILI